ncbi:hypothetical protein M885DRAFT_591708 [Pelagophyceae sp. CCMP2097]|nr:hypothetical protein M885DRAFT_591708 [Pelagophyceae sp. CCMP2097]
MAVFGWLLCALWQCALRAGADDVYTKSASDATYVESCNGGYATHAAGEVLRVRRHAPAAQLPLPETDAIADTGLCGVESSGDREAFLRFDMRDFSEDAVGAAVLRLTPSDFAPDTTVHVVAGCDAAPGAEAIDWLHRPAGGEARCAWAGDGAALHDTATRACDVTADARAAAGKFLCVALVGAAGSGRHEAVFHADADARPGRAPTPGLPCGSARGADATSAPHLRINGMRCGARLPDRRGPGCS